MKKAVKRFLSLVIVVCMAFIGVFVTPVVKADAAAGTWTLVTDASTLKAGDKVVIAAKDSAVALSTTQNGNNRGQATVTKNGDNTLTYTSEVQELTLETGKTSGTFAFYTGSGYLYAASSSKNYLRTETTLSANSSWNISIASDGVATVKATGTNTRNWMQYNKSSSIFASYSGAQQSIVIYQYVVAQSGGSDEGETQKLTINDIQSYMSLAYKYSAKNTVTTVDAFVKVTEEPIDWSGDYLIVYEAGKVAFNGGLEKLDAVSNTISVTIHDGKIEANDTTKAAQFTIEKSGDNYTIQSASGMYIGETSTSNGLDSSDSVLLNTISFDSGVVVIKASGGLSLQFNKNSGQTRFRYFGSAQQPIALYKFQKNAMTKEVATINGESGEFRLRCAVDASLADVEGVQEGSYGIQVSTENKTKKYTTWEQEDDKIYVVIGLGDILNNETRLTTEFTVAAYNGDTISTNTKTYSVLSMIKEYFDNDKTKDIVSELYKYFESKGFYGEVA